MLDLLIAQVDAEAALYVSRLQRNIELSTRYGKRAPTAVNPIAIAIARQDCQSPATPQDIQASMSFLFGDQIKEALRRAFEEMDWPAGAEPLKGRDTCLSELDKNIASVEAEIDDLRAEAGKAGILV
ncbi:MAG: hypothetical protein KDH15_16720 [Rhodocyclaceae bacterium]|nr:hypothetical protein [Rhodocyclaceae bacterium]